MPISAAEKKKVDDKIDRAKAKPGVDKFTIRDLSIDGAMYAEQRCKAEDDLRHVNTLSPRPNTYTVIMEETP